MTDRPKDETQHNELVLDWDDEAVESFRLEIESSARAEAAPFPQRADTEPPLGSARERPTLPPPADLSSLADVEPLTGTTSLPPPRRSTLPPSEGTGQRFRPSLPPATLVPGGSRQGGAFSSTLSGVPPFPPPPGGLRSGVATLRPESTTDNGAPARIMNPSGKPSSHDAADRDDAKTGEHAPVRLNSPGGTLRPGSAPGTLRPGAPEPPVHRGAPATPPRAADLTVRPNAPKTAPYPTVPEVTIRPSPPETAAQFRAPDVTVRPSPPEVTIRPSRPETTTRPSPPEVTVRPSAPETDFGSGAPEGARPRMYQPPTPRELEALLASVPDDDLLDLDEEDSDATQIASVPRELIEALMRRARENENRATERPAPPPPGESLAPELETASEQEFDEALSDLDWAGAQEDNDNAALRATPHATHAIPPAPPPASLRAPHALADDDPQVLHGLEELLPPVTRPPARAPVELKQPRTDRGAKVAAHTVDARKTPAGYGPLSALDDSGKRARIELLRALAQHKTERARAALLTAAGELAEELHDLDTAGALYALAHEADPELLTPLRWLARLAFERRDFEAYLAWLERETEATQSAHGRALAYAALARARWLLSRDLGAAHEAVREAVRLDPESTAHRLLLARVELAVQPQQADANLIALAGMLVDDPLAAALLTCAGRAHEQRSDAAGAKQLYRAACERSARAADACFALSRLARAERATGEAAQALLGSLPGLGVGALSEAVRRHAAVLLATEPARRSEALALLDEAGDGVSLRTAYALAGSAGDRPAQERAALAWTTHSDGQERALALVAQAELASADMRESAAAEALAEALRVDRSLSLAKVLWEALARDSSEVRRFLEGTLPEGAERSLRGAAKLAFDAAGAPAEVALLTRQGAQHEAAFPRALLLDASAEAGDVAALHAQLEQNGEQRPSPGSLLALVDFARRRLSGKQAEPSLRLALEAHPESALVTRAYLHAFQAPDERVDALITEAASSRGIRAAFLYVLAGQLQSDPNARLLAFERAHDALPTYGPAVFALHAEARRQNELERLSNLHAREASRVKDPFEAVSHLVRAALVRASADGDAAAAQLSRAMDLAPADPVLRELVIRLGDAIPASLRAEALQRNAERALAPFDRPATLAAAGAFEDAGQAERALALYEAVLRDQADDAIAEMGRERVARAAGKTRELLEAKRRAVSEAATDAGRVRALEELLQADSDAPREEALDRARALLVLAPAHPLALRRTEQYAMERGDNAALFDAELRLFNSSSGPKDKLARLRMLWLLTSLRTRERARADELDKLIIDAAQSSFGGPWLGRQLLGAGLALTDARTLLAAIDLFASETSDAVELAALAVQRARLELPDPPHDREARLKACLDAYPEHPTAREALAELAIARGDPRGAATLFAEAAQRALHRPRAARLWARAGKLHRDELSDPEQARQAYAKAAAADVTFGDVESKLRELLGEQGDQPALIELTKAQLAGSPGPVRARELRIKLAALHEQSGDTKLAIAGLRETLSETLEDLPTLRELSRLLGRDNDHRERAQILLRIARLSREAVELRDVFMQLGEIYDRELPDPKRAEAAYQRALKLGPKHVPALERLAALYAREEQHDNAEATLARLAQVVEAGARKIEVSLELARTKEKRADLRGAEEVLEGARREAPLASEVLGALADFYRRQGALSALAMHLNRASSDLRLVLEQDPAQSAAWITLVRMLEEKQRPDAARVVASLAYAFGVSDERVTQRLDALGNVPGVAGAGFSELLDDLVFSDTMPPSTRIVFRHGAEALNKAVPFDLRAVGGERLDKRHPLRAVVQEVARWAGLADVDVFTSSQHTLAFVPIGDAPVQLLVGKSLLDTLSRDEQLFLSARALKIGRAHMSLTCRVRPEEMGLLVHGLIRSQLPSHAPAGLDLAALDELSRRIAKHLNKRSLPELTPALLELAGIAGFDPARIYTVASAAGNRAALLACGSVRAALAALTKLAGLPVPAAFDRSLITQVDQAQDLLSFALSEAHFEARLRAGAEQR